MDREIEIREVSRHEVSDAVAFGKPLGVEVAAGDVRWLSSLSAKRGDEWIGVALTAPDATDTHRVWVAVDEGFDGRAELVGLLIDKAMFKLASMATRACALVVCGDDGEAMASRACWRYGDDDRSNDGEPAGGPRSLDDVLADASGRRADDSAQDAADPPHADGDASTDTAQAA